MNNYSSATITLIDGEDGAVHILVSGTFRREISDPVTPAETVLLDVLKFLGIGPNNGELSVNWQQIN